MKILVKFSADWADEFQAEGLVIMTKDQVAQLERMVDEELFSFYFGTNEGFDGGDITIDDFTFTEISEEEEAFLVRLIPDLKSGRTFGQMFDSAFVEEALLNTTE